MEVLSVSEHIQIYIYSYIWLSNFILKYNWFWSCITLELRLGRSQKKRDGPALSRFLNSTLSPGWHCRGCQAHPGLTGQPSQWLSCKESTFQCGRHRFDPWVGKMPWRREWQPTPVFLPRKFREQRSLAGPQSMGVAKSWTRFDNWVSWLFWENHCLNLSATSNWWVRIK